MEPKIINHIGLSSGKDSTALWGWAINESGYDPATIRGSFCDTQNEYQEVYDQIEKLSEYGQKRGVAPITTLHSIGFLNLAIKKKRFPSARARFCTEQLKIVPSRNYILSFIWLMGYEVVAHSGVRGDESTERGLLQEWGDNEGLGCKIRRPLLKWTINDVWAAHKRFKLPINPLYLQGRKRVGCRLCCMSTKEDVRLTAKHHPETIDLYREWEAQVGEHKESSFRLRTGENQEKYSGFFCATTTTEKFRSARYVRADGKEFSVCTIDDVVAWSKTLRGGKEVGFDFMYEEDDAHSPCSSGYCE